MEVVMKVKCKKAFSCQGFDMHVIVAFSLCFLYHPILLSLLEYGSLSLTKRALSFAVLLTGRDKSYLLIV